MTEKNIEKEIQEKHLNAPRLTPDRINDCIIEKYYHIIPNSTMTICVLTLQNGFQVIGHSAAASKENFDKDLGKKIAFDNAKKQIWQLEGYLLKQKLFEEKNNDN